MYLWIFQFLDHPQSASEAICRFSFKNEMSLQLAAVALLVVQFAWP